MAQAMGRKLARRAGWTVATIAIITAALIFAELSFAKVEMTAGGVNTRLLLPFMRGAIGIPVYSGTGEHVTIRGYLAGPVVRRKSDGNWSATWFCEDTVKRTQGHGETLRIECAGMTHDFPLAALPVANAIAPMPDKLIVLSDIEGNSRFLGAALRKLGVVDTSGNWSFGNGHLVILGDSVDRGRDVFAVLWRLRTLAAQAEVANGAVHVLLGNHEQYLLRGNVSRAHPEYRYALQQLGGYTGAFANDSVLGEWLRRQPVALKLGSVLFTHAGISPEVADAGLTIEALNQAMRDYWSSDASIGAEPSPALDAVMGLDGVTRYRGYFRDSGNDRPAATQQDIEQILARYHAERIVVGHTLVDQITHRYNGRVTGIDVNHPEARPEVLVFDHGEPHIVDIGTARGFEDDTGTRLREFSLFDASDRKLLASIYRANRTLARIPHPY